MTKYETTILYIVGITDFIKRMYIKAFPPIAVIIAAVCVVGLPDGVANGKVQSEHIPYIFAAAAIFTAGVVLWFALSNEVKLERKRGHYERGSCYKKNKTISRLRPRQPRAVGGEMNVNL